MTLEPSRILCACVSIALVAGSASPGLAIDRMKDGWYETGKGVRQKSVAFVNVDVYEIHHYAKELPAQKSKAAMIELDADKRLAWKMLRSVGAEKMRDALKSGYEMNGYKDEAKIAKFTGAINNEMKEGSRVIIAYDAAKKATTITVDGGGSATVEGADFMRATWSVWFGKIDQPKLSDALIKAL